MKIIRLLIKLVLAVAVLYGGLVAYNLFLDEELDPELAALLDDPWETDVAPEDNGIYYMIGLMTVGDDPHAAGMEIARANMERIEAGDLSLEVLSLPESLPMENTPWEDAGELLAGIESNREELERLIQVNSELLARYEALLSYEAVETTADLKYYIFKSLDLQGINRLYLQRCLLQAVDGDVDQALEDAFNCWGFWMKACNGRNYTLIRFVTYCVMISNAEDYLSEISTIDPQRVDVQKYTGILKDQVDEINISFSAMMGTEVSFNAHEVMDRFSFLDGETIMNQFGGPLMYYICYPLFRKNETLNMYYRMEVLVAGQMDSCFYEDCEALPEAEVQEYASYIEPGLHYLVNPFGKKLLSLPQLENSDLVLRTQAILITSPTLLRLALEIVSQGVAEDDVQAWLDARPERDPATGGPFMYDPDQRALLGGGDHGAVHPVVFP